MGSLSDRFHAKFDVHESGCWLWNAARGGRDRRGWMLGGAGKSVFAHRVAWELYRGPIPAGSKVLHTCDVPHCVNPGHLFLGTQADNVSDCRTKGRIVVPKGISASPEAVRDIRTKGKTQKEYSIQYGIARVTVSDIQRGKSWRWV